MCLLLGSPGVAVPRQDPSMLLLLTVCQQHVCLAMQGICLVLGSPGVAVPHRDPDPGNAFLWPSSCLLLQPTLQCRHCPDLPHHAVQPQGTLCSCTSSSYHANAVAPSSRLSACCCLLEDCRDPVCVLHVQVAICVPVHTLARGLVSFLLHSCYIPVTACNSACLLNGTICHAVQP